MQNDYFELNGQDHRIEWNWNSISNFIEDTDLELADIDKIVQKKPRVITKFFHVAFVEGGRLDGIPFPFTPEELGGMLEVNDVTELLKIYFAQIASKQSQGKAKKK